VKAATIWEDLRSSDDTNATSAPEMTALPSSSTSEQIIEAQGWIEVWKLK
jgi:hypothetical protein